MVPAALPVMRTPAELPVDCELQIALSWMIAPGDASTDGSVVASAIHSKPPLSTPLTSSIGSLRFRGVTEQQQLSALFQQLSALDAGRPKFEV